MVSKFNILDRQIGPSQPTYIIAELSANHGNDFARAEQILRAAAHTGADAVKLQTYTADTLTLDCNQPPFQIAAGTVWDGVNLHQLYQQARMPWDWQPRLKQIAEEVGLHLFSSPFDNTAVDFLESLDVPAYKIASFEIVDSGLLKRVAATHKPVIVSTGMATASEIDQAITTLRDHGSDQIALLKCTSAYPAPPSSMNLKTIQDMVQRFGVPVGLSDHSLGIAAAVCSVALGASIIEKHLTLSRDDGGPDSSFSMEPDEFAQMVRAVRTAEQAMGQVIYGPVQSDGKNRCFRRSLFVVADVEPGETFTESNVRSIRPADGLPPKHLDEILGRVATENIPRGTPLSWKHVA